ncbi:MAG: DUF2270 domain-containing protein [Gammaproteobacteria bacterium]|jgi:uncharacterized membrane protein
MDTVDEQEPARSISAAELGAIAHLYRGEVYRSTIWRTRLDNTTNWTVVTLGVALSISYSSPQASSLPLVLVGVLIMFFVIIESRRYRYFNVWRARARWMETHLYAPMLSDGNLHMEEGWQEVLAHDYWKPRYHISFFTALGRRIRRNYLWILIVQTFAYLGKLAVHPTGITGLDDLWVRASVGPVPGQLMIAGGIVYISTWCAIAAISYRADRLRRSKRTEHIAMG